MAEYVVEYVLAVGDRVQCRGLQEPSRLRLNGTQGIVRGHQNGRILVALDADGGRYVRGRRSLQTDVARLSQLVRDYQKVRCCFRRPSGRGCWYMFHGRSSVRYGECGSRGRSGMSYSKP